MKESRVINGYALNLGRAAQGMVKKAGTSRSPICGTTSSTTCVYYTGARHVLGV